MLIGADGRVRIADFGMARVEGTVYRGYHGTIRWAAPENLKETAELCDRKGDVYSYGAVALHTLRLFPCADVLCVDLLANYSKRTVHWARLRYEGQSWHLHVNLRCVQISTIVQPLCMLIWVASVI